MSAEKYMERALHTIVAPSRIKTPHEKYLAEKVAALCAEIEAETREECAKEMADTAEGLRYRARKTREEWCGPDMEPDDRAANFADARNDERMARTYDTAAALLRRAGKP